MKKEFVECEVCKKRAFSEKQQRKENWLLLHGGSVRGISVWLDKPRKRSKNVSASYMLSVGFRDRDYDFCSIDCLVKALKGKESI